MEKSAVISKCGKYRYELRRIWDSSKPLVLFIGLNPSTADHQEEDQTSKVCINYAKRWGYGGLIIANLFAYRSTDKSKIRHVNDPVGSENNKYLRKLIAEAADVICAWTDDGGYMDRDAEVLKMIDDPKCLMKLKSGRPGHPLYKNKELLPIRL